MQKPLPCALAVAAIAVAGAWFWASAGEEPPPAEAQSASLTHDDATAASGSMAQHEPDAQPRESIANTTGAIDLGHSHSFALHIRAIDENGLPQSGRRVRIAPIGCTRNVMEERTNEEGRATVEWKGQTKSMRMGLALGREAVREIVVESGAARELTGFVARDSGGMAFTIQSNGTGEQTLQLVASTDEDDSLDASACMLPHVTFSDRLLAGAPISEVKALDGLPLVGRFFASVVTDNDSATIAIQPANRPAVRGVVYAEDGKPAPRQLVALLRDSSDARIASTQTDADGAFTLDRDVMVGPAQIYAGGRSLGLARQTLDVNETGATRVQLNLQRGQRIDGKATGKDGKPVAGFVVDYEALDGTWVDRALVRDDGTFTLPNLPAVAARLLLREKASAAPVAVIASALPDSGLVAFDLSGEAEPKGAITLRLPERATTKREPTAPAPAKGQDTPMQFRFHFGGNGQNEVQVGTNVETSVVAFTGGEDPDRESAATVFAWQSETGFGLAIPRAADGTFSAFGLRNGYYRIEVRDLGIGTVDLGQHFVDGRGTLDLGLVRLPQAAQLRIEGSTPGTQIELFHRRADCDVRAAKDVGNRTEVELPAGRWLAAIRKGDEPVLLREFVLHEGKATVLQATVR